ncbi:hypothetical protein PHLGIDRAFT_130081 [Phlebiopsis gigantea 11061_1 CR5-6]|uniref:HMG box domain-containing protein n=1 Tax=Phlebiopsis gigantea (strain 11061_1 CR5-6) TaxID=745531 RepID=A0A0C3RST1_PHLG1|nr:hypothetical protein PHLGIDRAFT_130081 [Phlebiopsis gigantea 11061_1 CR5-6]
MSRHPSAPSPAAHDALDMPDDLPRLADGEASDDLDVPEDPHLALTSQTLNPDGTPKRPMNAFMIFARKRRPQISAANQMMRTGDISKILSKEWNAMEMSEKKFYLDQAKKLKDNFNNKYPDYVYRRRPNNSRKKRKPDQDPQSPTDPSLGDADDASLDDTSPVDMDDPRDHAAAPYLYRPGSGPGTIYEGGEAFMPSHANTSYTYMPPDFSGNQYGHASRLAAATHHDEPISHNSLTPLRIPSLAETVANAQGLPYSASRHDSQTTITSPSQTAHSTQYWDTRQPRSDTARSGASSWPVLPALDTVPAQRSAQGGQISSRSEGFSPQVPNRPWSSSASSATSSSSGGGGASGSHYATSPFPTLASPSPEYFSRPSYAGAGGSYASQWPAQQQQRALPALQSLSTYALPSASSASPPPSSSGTQASQMYWERARYEGR